MKIERTTNHNGNLLPRAIDLLSAESNAPLYNLKFQLRHPRGIYNVSLRNLAQSFGHVLRYLDEVHKFEAPYINNHAVNDLLFHQRWLLYFLMEYIEDSQNILQCFFPSKYERSKSRAVKRFLKKIDAYRNHVASIVNRMKHHQGILGAIVGFKDGFVVPSYFIEVMNEDGALEPFIPTGSNSNSVFTFARDLRVHLYSVYMVSEHLAEALEEILQPSALNPHDNFGDSIRWFQVASRISSLHPVFLLDERELETPQITPILNKDYATLMLEYPGNIDFPELSAAKGISIQIFEADGVSRTYKLPLWDRESEPKFFKQ